MKINRLLTAALITFATVFTGCVKESVWDVKTGIDSSKAAPEGFSFDANVSSNTSIAVYWDGQAAKAAGAKSFLVQLTDETNMDKGNTWDTNVTKVLEISDDPTANYESTIFKNLTEGNKYYVRVRANYPGSIYSEWAYIASPENKPIVCEVGIGPINPDAVKPESLTYNTAKGTATSMTFDAVATAAKNAGAKGLMYVLTNYETGIAVRKETGITTLTATFDELELKSQHKAKLAAVYENELGSVYFSDWVYASALVKNSEGQNVKTELFEAGIGAVEDKGVRPRIQLVYATASELAVEWTSTGFKNPAADFESTYSIQLYTDNECTDLLISWEIGDKRGAGTQQYTPEGSCPRFAFSGLDANTTYYARVTNKTTEMSSSPVEMKTKDFTPVTNATTPIAAGEIALAEDFSESIWGGNYVTLFPGYSANNRGSVEFIKATGENPVGATEAGFYLVAAGTEIGLFNTLKVAVPKTRLATWGYMTEHNTAGGFICARQGLLKLGASKYLGRIVTPPLSNLSETATIELTFNTAVYQEKDKPDVTSGGVWVITTSDDVTKTQNFITNAEGISTPVYKYDLGKPTEWTTHTVEIPNVTPESRIMIGNIRTEGTVAGADQQRMFVDDIIIKVVSYGGGAELVPPTHTSITLTTAPRQITATWNPVEAASGYVLAYKKASDGDDAWTEVRLGKSETTYTIEGLKELTTYEIRVKATAFGDKESEWSAIVSAQTPKNPAAVKDIATAQAWIEFITGDYISSATDSADDVITLTADLDFAGVEYPAGAEFRGVINGNGKTIKNLVTSVPMFKSVTSVKDLTFDASCSFTSSASGTLAALAERTTGAITNVINNANITVNANDIDTFVAGGLVAYAYGDITGCANNATVLVATNQPKNGAVGGIVAYTEGKVNSSANNGAVTVDIASLSRAVKTTLGSCSAAAISVGGIVGLAQGTGSFEMNNCENNGAVTYDVADAVVPSTYERTQIGGIVGSPNGPVKKCKNTGDVNVMYYTPDRSAHTACGNIICVGGIGGGDYYATAHGDRPAQSATDYIECVNEGDVTVDNDAAKSNSAIGGIVGWPGKEGSVTNVSEGCINRGNITVKGNGKGRVGGIHGGSGNLVNCENYGEVKIENADAGSAIGGIAGFHSNGKKVEGCISKGNVTSVSTITGGIGGLIGNMGNVDHTTGENCVVDCTIVGGSVTNAGMVVGKFNGHKEDAKRKRIVLGPLEVSGTVNGNPASASNLCGTDMYVPEYHTINATIK
jgi:hypothetical protein